MPAAQFADFIQSTRSAYADTVSDGILEDFVIFKEIQSANGRPKEYEGIIGGNGGFWTNVGGNAFEWRVLSSQMEFSEWGPGVPVTATTPQTLVPVKQTMGGYKIPYFIDMFETMSMNTKEQYVPLLRLYEKMATRRWYSGFGTSLLKNSTTGGWQGLPAFVVTTGTYATLDMTQTYSKPFVVDYATNGLNFTLTCVDSFSKVQNGATHGDTQDAPNSPEDAFMNRTDWQTMVTAIEDQHKLVNINQDMLKFGFKNWTYRGVRAYWSDEMSVQSINKVYILNVHHIGIAHASPKLMVAETVNSLTGNVGIVAVSFSKSQAFCSNTRKQGLIDNTAG